MRRRSTQLPDQREYLALATNLLHGEGFFFLDPRFDENVYAYRTPGYPVFLAAVAADVRLARAAQALLDTSTVLAAYLLARRWLGRGAGAVAATFVALNPFLVYFSGLILTETLFTAMLAWGMVLLVPPPTAPARPRSLTLVAGGCPASGVIGPGSARGDRDSGRARRPECVREPPGGRAVPSVATARGGDVAAFDRPHPAALGVS